MSASIRPQDLVVEVSETQQASLRGLANEAANRLPEARSSGLVSVTLRLPAATLAPSSHLSPEVLWRPPDEPIELLARGEAFRAALPATSELAVQMAAWRTIGDETCPPCAFFTVPPPPRTSAGTIWWPAVLVRRTAAAEEVTFTAHGDGASRASTARRWAQEWDRFLAPPPRVIAAGRPELRKSLTPPARDWLDSVSATLAEIAEGRLEKVVLARRLVFDLPRPLDPLLLAQRLVRDHGGCHVVVVPHEGGHVVTASPERLAAKRGDHLVCDALAGTAHRSPSSGDEEREASALLACPKQRHEHAVVVDGIVAALGGVCRRVSASGTPNVRKLRSLLHLWTEVTAELRPGHGLLDVVSRLHPTAAVLGSPCASAGRWLDRLGERRDGLYTGVVGRIDQRGDGEAIVVLRSAYLTPRSAVLWAGAGIVAGSLPLSELREIDLKLDTMREALGCS